MKKYMERPITLAEIESLREFTKRETVEFWGHTYRVIPQLVSTVFGDGKFIITFNPANSRPDYYIILVDSSVNKDINDIMDYVYGEDHGERFFQAIETDYGSIDDRPRRRYALDLGSGWTVGYFHNQPLLNQVQETPQ